MHCINAQHSGTHLQLPLMMHGDASATTAAVLCLHGPVTCAANPMVPAAVLLDALRASLEMGTVTICTVGWRATRGPSLPAVQLQQSEARKLRSQVHVQIAIDMVQTRGSIMHGVQFLNARLGGLVCRAWLSSGRPLASIPPQMVRVPHRRTCLRQPTPWHTCAAGAWHLLEALRWRDHARALCAGRRSQGCRLGPARSGNPPGGVL